MSYALSAVILLSQAGLPLHMHYCKGMLESVSVFFSSACDDLTGVVKADACCTSTSPGHCAKEESDCCDDEVKVLLQDFDSLVPHFDKFADIQSIACSAGHTIFGETGSSSLPGAAIQHQDTGPPIYILFGSLIFYA